MNSALSWLEIDSNAFEANVHQYKKIIGDRYLAIVIKANAYGHGILQIALLAENNYNIHMLCVSSATEALFLRKKGITKKILILATIDQNPLKLTNKNIACCVYSKETIIKLNKAAVLTNTILPIHLKVDIGLSRLGINPEELDSTISLIQGLKNITLEGIFSHLSESHKKEKAFTQKQAHFFQQICNKALLKGLKPFFIHLANSAATTTLDLPYCNLFRVGAGIYGLWPSKNNQILTQKKYPTFLLKPIASWKTKIIHIKAIKKDDYVGYERSFRAPKAMRIAILPVGYADGYNFRLFNRACTLIHNEKAAVIGRISMNLMTVDITNINASIGDEVLLLGGASPVEPALLSSFAENANIREITTKINCTIPRIISSHKKKSSVRRKGILNLDSISFKNTLY